jgi:hypothetical protein
MQDCLMTPLIMFLTCAFLSHFLRRSINAIALTLMVGVCMPVLATTAGPAVFYVALEGSDGWSGRLAEANAGHSDGPFATLDRAREEIRELRKLQGLPESGVIVVVRGGGGGLRY